MSPGSCCIYCFIFLPYYNYTSFRACLKSSAIFSYSSSVSMVLPAVHLKGAAPFFTALIFGDNVEMQVMSCRRMRRSLPCPAGIPCVRRGPPGQPQQRNHSSPHQYQVNELAYMLLCARTTPSLLALLQIYKESLSSFHIQDNRTWQPVRPAYNMRN